MDLLTLVVPEAGLSDSFRALREQFGFAPARALIQDLGGEFIDRDGNFAEQFQTTGFDARTWELFLFALLRDQGAAIDWSNARPDFVFALHGLRVAIEAVTANPTQGAPALAEGDVDPGAYQRHGHAIKLGSALYSKLQKRYWELPHLAGLPFVLALEDFHTQGSLAYSGSTLWQYLYGIGGGWWFDDDGKLHVVQEPITEHRVGEKVIRSGFFDLPGAENVAAVLFGNSGTVAKFNRMGFLAGYGRDESITMIRTGLCYRHDDNSPEPDSFCYTRRR